MTFGFRQSDWRTLNAAFTSFPAIEKVLLFGSRAIARHRKGSDVDLAIIGENVNFTIVAAIHSLLEEESPLPYFFDLVDFSHLNQGDFYDHIKRVGVKIYDRHGTQCGRTELSRSDLLSLRFAPELQSLKAAFVSLNFPKLLAGAHIIALKNPDSSLLKCFVNSLLDFYSCHFAQYIPNEKVDLAYELKNLYEMYWWNAFQSRRTSDECERTLLNQLRELLSEQLESFAQHSTFESVEYALQAQLKSLGYGVRFGTSAPLRELIIWRHEEELTLKVQLVEGVADLTVSILGEFVSRGWMGFLSNDVWHTSRWLTSDRIFAVKDIARKVTGSEKTDPSSWADAPIDHIQNAARELILDGTVRIVNSQ